MRRFYVFALCILVLPISALSADYEVLFFTPATNNLQQGFVRVINHSNKNGSVTIFGIDDSGQYSSGTASFSLSPGQTKHFNSQDIEIGNPSKGLTGFLGDGAGNWRLVFRTSLDIELLAALLHYRG
ncbi:MAG: hypothetical protein K9K86_11435, partial [Pseudomonadales bacterium]|nr:hypothetical protein [Pseudomonadales bacterium]